MKLSCLQENLSWGLSVVEKAVGAKAPLQITNNILLTTDQSRLKLVATNLEIAVSCWIGAKIEEEGAITVPARLLIEFINSLPHDTVEINLPAKTKVLQLKCARDEARISGIDAKDFPPIPSVTEGVGVKVAMEEIKQGISRVAFAAATEESRPVLTGVDAKFEGSQLTLAAADGFRLAVYKLPLAAPVKQKTEVIIPAKTLNELKRLMTTHKEISVNPTAGRTTVKISTAEVTVEPQSKAVIEVGETNQQEPLEIMVNAAKSQAIFKLKNIELVSQLLQGTFPQYEQLIPQSSTSRAVINREVFLRATRTAAIFARDGSGIVRLIVTPGGELTPGKMTVSARSEEIGENTGELDVIVAGTEAKIAFNGKYLTDVLSVLPDAEVSLETTSPSSPGMIKPVGNENYVHVVMPMFVQW